MLTATITSSDIHFVHATIEGVGTVTMGSDGEIQGDSVDCWAGADVQTWLDAQDHRDDAISAIEWAVTCAMKAA